MSEYDIVMDGITIHLNDISTRCIAKAGCHGINLNGFGEEFKYNNIFKEKGRLHIPGFGMTPGTTNLMAKRACEGMETIYAIRVSHGAFRPFAFSRSIAETTRYEYDPALPGRVVWENGKFIQVPPFARPRLIALPEPYGTHEQYIIPHAETVTLAEYLKDRSPRLIEVRGTWPPRTMKLVRALHEWGFLRNEKIQIQGIEVGVMDCIAEYLLQSTEGTTTDLYGYALHVEVEGDVSGVPLRRTLWHTHPASDGSVAGWENCAPIRAAWEFLWAWLYIGWRKACSPKQVRAFPNMYLQILNCSLRISPSAESISIKKKKGSKPNKIFPFFVHQGKRPLFPFLLLSKSCIGLRRHICTMVSLQMKKPAPCGTGSHCNGVLF